MLFSRKTKNRKSQTSKRPETFKRQKASSLRSIASTVSDSSVATASVYAPSSFGGSSRHGPSVRFNNSVTVKQTLHVRDYTPEELCACWYDRFESEEIINEAKFVSSLYEDSDLLVDENKYPRRGLELYMVMPNDDTAKQSRRAVLEEQQKLNALSKKKRDASKIRSSIESAYTVYTQGSRMQARLLALSDELAISEDDAAFFAAGFESLDLEPVPMRI